MVAKGIFGSEFDSSQVNTVITLATPHKQPIVSIDQQIVEFYQKTNQLWLNLSNETADIAVASIGGSNRDVMVRSGLTQMDGSLSVLVKRCLK